MLKSRRSTHAGPPCDTSSRATRSPKPELSGTSHWTQAAIPTISIDTSALQAPAHRAPLRALSSNVAFAVDSTAHYSVARTQRERRIPTQHIISFMDFLETTEKEMELEVRRVKAGIRDVRHCVKALKKERRKAGNPPPTEMAEAAAK